MNFNEYHELIKTLISKIRESGYKPDSVIGIIRGGYIPAEAISRAFNVPLVVIRSSSYHNGVKTNKPVISDCIGQPVGNALIVDDLIDSGETLMRVKEHFKEFNPKTAVLWIKKDNIADFYVVRAKPDEWIEQPMEMYNNC